MPATHGSGATLPTDIIRTETVLSKLPIHALAKRGQLDIAITQLDAHGAIDLQWNVSYNQRYGPPRQLAYKLDTLVVNRRLDTLERPLPQLIRLGSLRDICDALRLTCSGRMKTDIKHALHQNAGAYITAKLRYTSRDGAQQSLETGFTRYRVIFTGQRLPSGLRADAVYLALHEPYWEVLDRAPVRPLDYEYLTTLAPSAQRFYELLSYQMFAALRHNRAAASLRYSTYCLFAPQRRYTAYDRVKKQMYKVHRPHLRSGYLAAVQTELSPDAQGEPDWVLRYTPGPKARAEYEAFTGSRRQARAPLQGASRRPEPAESLGGDSEASLLEPLRADSPTHSRKRLPSEGERDARVERQACEPTASNHDVCRLASRPADASAAQTDPATGLVQQFYRDAHGVSSQTPHAREIEHAQNLLQRHGAGFASFFVTFAQGAARREGRTVHVFGGLMRYEASALAAYRRQTAQTAAQQAESRAQQQRQQLDAYEAWLRRRLDALKAALPPEALDTLRDQARQQVGRRRLPPYLLERYVEHEVETQLMQAHALPSFEDWSKQQEP